MSRIDIGDPETIAILTEALEAAGIDGLEITRPGQQLRLVVTPGGSPRNGTSPSSLAKTVVRSPLAGEFHADVCTFDANMSAASKPGLVGVVRLGPILVPVEAANARVTEYLVESGAIIGFGDPICEVEYPQ